MSEHNHRIIFVCTGNICRSPLAHSLFASLVEQAGVSHRFRIDSAGTDGWEVGRQADARMRKTAAAHGLRIDHVARQITLADLEENELVLAMDRSNLSDIRRLAKGRSDHIKLFREFDPEGGPDAEVADPYYEGPDAFERTYRIVERTSRNLLEKLVSRSTSSGLPRAPGEGTHERTRP